MGLDWVLKKFGKSEWFSKMVIRFSGVAEHEIINLHSKCHTFREGVVFSLAR